MQLIVCKASEFECLVNQSSHDDDYYNNVQSAWVNLLGSIEFLTNAEYGLSDEKFAKWKSRANLILQKEGYTTKALKIVQILKTGLSNEPVRLAEALNKV